jgi:hypothetical protein
MGKASSDRERRESMAINEFVAINLSPHIPEVFEE